MERRGREGVGLTLISVIRMNRKNKSFLEVIIESQVRDSIHFSSFALLFRFYHQNEVSFSLSLKYHSFDTFNIQTNSLFLSRSLTIQLCVLKFLLALGICLFCRSTTLRDVCSVPSRDRMSFERSSDQVFFSSSLFSLHSCLFRSLLLTPSLSLSLLLSPSVTLYLNRRLWTHGMCGPPNMERKSANLFFSLLLN